MGARALRTIEMTNTKERQRPDRTPQRAVRDAPSLAATFKSARTPTTPVPPPPRRQPPRTRGRRPSPTRREAACEIAVESGAWAAWLGALMARGAVSRRRACCSGRSMCCRRRARRAHLEVAQLEFKHGSRPRPHDVRRRGQLPGVDVWSVYLDMELKAGDDTLAPPLQRVTSSATRRRRRNSSSAVPRTRATSATPPSSST